MNTAGAVRWAPRALLLPVLAVLSACQDAVESGDGRVQTAPPTLTSQEFGPYVVHFNALATDQVPAEIAATYGIVRSKNRAMLNVSILKKSEGNPGTAVPATVKASATNLTGQFKNTRVREIREGNAIYYIAELAVAHGETLTFNIEATPENEVEPFMIRFQRQFFAD